MHKNQIIDDLIALVITAVLFSALHLFADPAAGAITLSKITIAPLFAIALASFADLTLVHQTAPRRSFATVVKGTSFGIIIASIFVLFLIDLSDRTTVIIAFAVMFIICSFARAIWGKHTVTDAFLQKRTRFHSVAEFDTYAATMTPKRSDIWAFLFAAIVVIYPFGWGNVVFGVTFPLFMVFTLSQKLELRTAPIWYSPLRLFIAAGSFGATIGLNV